MRDAVIVEAVRTPVGRRGGMLADVHPADLSAVVLRAVAERTGLDPALIDDVIWGCVSQVGEQTFDIARTAVLSAGWPESVPGTTVDRQCGSSQQAIHFAAAGVIAGHYDLVVAGGVESMTRVPMGSAFGGALADRRGLRGALRPRHPEPGHRRGDDRGPLGPHPHAARRVRARLAREGGRRDRRGPLPGPDRAGRDRPPGAVDTDEGVRRGGTLEKLATLQPAFREDGVLHAGNSSQISDGAAALLLCTSETAARHGLTPIARVHTAVLAGDDPNMMLTAPIPATRRALERAGLDVGEIGAFEVSEAFAAVPLAWLEETGADPARLNPCGGAIALGHPLGASGARLATTLLHHLRDHGIRYGLQTMCEGGGQANATIYELLA